MIFITHFVFVFNAAIYFDFKHNQSNFRAQLGILRLGFSWTDSMEHIWQTKRNCFYERTKRRSVPACVLALNFLSSESVFLIRDAGLTKVVPACSAERQWKSLEKGSIIQHQRENKIWVQVKECHKLNSSSASICPLSFGWAQERKHPKKKKESQFLQAVRWKNCTQAEQIKRDFRNKSCDLNGTLAISVELLSPFRPLTSYINQTLSSTKTLKSPFYARLQLQPSSPHLRAGMPWAAVMWLVDKTFASTSSWILHPMRWAPSFQREPDEGAFSELNGK